MTTISIELSDELARRFEVERDRLPQVLALGLSQLPPRITLPSQSVELPSQVFHEMVDFLAGRPTPAEILAFKVSQAAQARLSQLLEKNREESLTASENAELGWYEYVNDIMIRLKVEGRSNSN